MLLASPQVALQAPPGLEGVRARQPPIDPVVPCAESGDTGEPAPACTPSLVNQDFKQELVREVTAAVRDHIEWKTAAAVESLWKRGQQAIQYMEQQHTSETERLHSQLAACAESYRSLERENAMLRSNLEALMKHLAMVFGPPPHFRQQGPMGFNPTPLTPDAVQAQAPRTPAHTPEAAEAPGPQQMPSTVVSKAADTLQTSDFEGCQEEDELLPAPQPATPRTPSTSAAGRTSGLACGTVAAVATTMSAPSVAAVSSGATAATAAVPAAVPAPLATFTLTLRRADSVPLGLDIAGETGGKFLIVAAVRPGGAVEAWNRQCLGEMREIRPGDRIIGINGVEDADGMREECLKKHLVKMTVQRAVSFPSNPTSCARPTTLASASVGLRADASEFVPEAVVAAATAAA